MEKQQFKKGDFVALSCSFSGFSSVREMAFSIQVIEKVGDNYVKLKGIKNKFSPKTGKEFNWKQLTSGQHKKIYRKLIRQPTDLEIKHYKLDLLTQKTMEYLAINITNIHSTEHRLSNMYRENPEKVIDLFEKINKVIEKHIDENPEIFKHISEKWLNKKVITTKPEDELKKPKRDGIHLE